MRRPAMGLSTPVQTLTLAWHARGASRAKAVRAAPAARLDPELAAFRAEISAIDGDATAPVAEASGEPEPEVPASPPPGEREY